MQTKETLLNLLELDDFCVSCDQRKASAKRNPDGLCDDCNGGIYRRKTKAERVKHASH